MFDIFAFLQMVASEASTGTQSVKNSSYYQNDVSNTNWMSGKG